ncbi:MAG TPA: hypothetical protein VIZ22_01475 [Candidatus Limnocylindrales bacterium]
MSEDARVATISQPATGRRRGILAGIALVLACISILVTTVGIWTHQVALNTNRFTQLITEVTKDPAVTDPIADRISAQVVEAVDVQGRLEARLPDIMKPLAGTMTLAIQNGIDQRLRIALQNPRVNAALLTSIGWTHERLVRLLRGESVALVVVDGYVMLNVFPVVGAALTELQASGIIPADVQLPDLSSPEAPDALAQRLNAAFGITLPPTFGMIQLMPADKVVAAQSAVRIFDLLVIFLIILSVVLVALTLWLAGKRRRMVIFLAIGTIIAFLIARLVIGSIEDAVVSGIADGDIAAAIRAMVDATLEDLRSLTIIIIIATAIVGVAAYLWGRPKWVTDLTSGDTGGDAPAA